MDSNKIIENVKYYYGIHLKSSKDLKTNACTMKNQLSSEHLKLSENIPLEITEKSYGCGFIMPSDVKDKKIIDLGCGSGRDSYLLSQIIGEKGSIIGVDITSQQIDIANKYIKDFQQAINGISSMDFICGNLEDLKGCGIDSKAFDIAISNCVINLTANKKEVFRNIFEVLKDGGELYFSDIYSDREISEEIKQNKVLWGECLSGALYWKRLFELCKFIGFSTPRLVEANQLKLSDDILEKVGDVKFISATYRVFKIKVEIKGYSNIKYLGKESNQFDILNIFRPNKIYTVDAELYSILWQSRFKDLFEIMATNDENETVSKIDINPFYHSKTNIDLCCQSKCC